MCAVNPWLYVMRFMTITPDGMSRPKPRTARSGFLWLVRRPRPEIRRALVCFVVGTVSVDGISKFPENRPRLSIQKFYSLTLTNYPFKDSFSISLFFLFSFLTFFFFLFFIFFFYYYYYYYYILIHRAGSA